MASSAGRSFFDQKVIDEVRAATDIVGLVGEAVTLRRQGRNYLGLCPFHTEKTPSFTVSPDKQMFHCFGCGTGGDAFSFLQRREGVSFPDAVRRLAERAGLRLPEPELTQEQAQQRDQHERLRHTMELASAQYQRWLWGEAGREARAYLAKRGFSDETLRRFQVGWAPAAWDGLLTALAGRGVEAAGVVRAGLAVRGEEGGRAYDRFRGRVMFPIWDSRGRAVAFGGRVLPGTPEEERGPKYLNSPETELFSKGRGLWAWHLAKGAIRERGHAVLVEGYLDAISCHQAGFGHAVASLGTALTVQQARLLLSGADQVRVAYDADAAGQGAAGRGVDLLADLGADVRIVALPEGKDPDECIARGGAAAFAAALEAAIGYVEFRFRTAQAAAAGRYGPGTAQAAAATAAAIAPTIGSLASPVAREQYVQRFARLLGTSEASLWGEVRRAAGAGARPSAGTTQERPEHRDQPHRDNKGNPGPRLLGTPAWRLAQEQLVAIMLADPGRVAAVREQVQPEEFGDEACRGIVRALYETAAAASMDGASGGGGGGAIALVRLLEQSGQHQAASLVARLLVQGAEQDPDSIDRVCRDCLRVLQEHRLANRITEVRQEVERLEREGRPVPARLLEEYTRLVRAAKGNGSTASPGI